MSKKENRKQTATISFTSNRRMPKGWTSMGTSELREPEKTYAEKLRDTKQWYKIMIDAEKHNKALKEEIKRRKKKDKSEEDVSNAETLVEKKYHKEKKVAV